jgi:hypothetical protein
MNAQPVNPPAPEVGQAVAKLQGAAQNINNASEGRNVRQNVTAATNKLSDVPVLLQKAALKTNVPEARQRLVKAATAARNALIVDSLNHISVAMTAIGKKANQNMNNINKSLNQMNLGGSA